MKELIFLLADVWMIYAGFTCGWKFIRLYGNYLLGLEWMIVGASGVNFLVWSLLGGDAGSPQYWLVYFFDALSRSFGVTLIAVLGLLRVTHRYHPSRTVDCGAFALAAGAGLYLQQFHHGFHAGPATFYVVVNVMTSIFLCWFVSRLWRAGARPHAIAIALATAAGSAIAVTYDFFPIPGDDEYRTIFYTLALATWGTQMFVIFRAYRALYDRTAVVGAGPDFNRRADARA